MPVSRNVDSDQDQQNQDAIPNAEIPESSRVTGVLVSINNTFRDILFSTLSGASMLIQLGANGYRATSSLILDMMRNIAANGNNIEISLVSETRYREIHNIIRDMTLFQSLRQFIGNVNLTTDHSSAENENPRPAYSNTTTFAALKSISEIAPDKLVVLDNYAFDLDELIDYVKDDLHNINRNPHLIFDQMTDFSSEAKELIREHEVLGKFVEELNQQMSNQKQKIQDKTIGALVFILVNLDYFERQEHGEAGTQLKAGLDEHMASLTHAEQNDLNNFVIEMPVKGGGWKRVKFKETFDQCTDTSEEYLWRFIVTVTPNLEQMISYRVLERADRYNLIISPNRQGNIAVAESDDDSDNEDMPSLSSDFEETPAHASQIYASMFSITRIVEVRRTVVTTRPEHEARPFR